MNKIKHEQKNNEQNKVKYGFYYYSCNLMLVSELLKAILAGFLAMFGIWDDCGGAVERGRLEAKND